MPKDAIIGQEHLSELLTLGAHAQRGLRYLVCLSVCLSVCMSMTILAL